jgi:tetratricopeptide (TPR) repeat protein
MRPAGGGDEFLLLNLVDDSDGEQTIANADCTLPPPEQVLGQTGLTVDEFLARWRQGERYLEPAARQYGRLLYRHLLLDPPEVREAWNEALRQASGCGLRLEIRLPRPGAALWREQSVLMLPFELLCDDNGFLFRRPGWSTLRRPGQTRSRRLRLAAEAPQSPVVQVAWANVGFDDEPALPEQHFSAHQQAVERLAVGGRAVVLPARPQATRSSLAKALATQQPHVLVWIGHGLGGGSALVLHDAEHPQFPQDPGIPVAAADFANDVRAGGVDVALLWSCHGAGTQRPLDIGVAEALLSPDHGDVAAVLAAFSALEAPTVAKLSAALIEAWADSPDGDLEAALARARSGLDEQSLTWARPVLFLRTPPAESGPRLQAPPPPLPASAPAQRLRWLPQLPAASQRYIDHRQRLARLSDDLAQHPVVVLEGLPGVGKTELALALAHQRRAAGEDVAFIDVSGHADLGNLRQTLGLLVREKPFDSEAELIGALAGRQWTLLIDNAEDLLATPAARQAMRQLLAALLTTGPGFRCVITSRRALASAGSAEAAGLYSREVDLLGADEARELFIAAAGARLAPAAATSALLDPLLDELGGIARAIVLMAGQLGGEVNVATLRQRLQDTGAQAIVAPDLVGVPVPAKLDRKLHKERLVSALNLSLAAAAAQLPESLELFDALGAFPAGLSQALLPHAEFPWLTDALGVLLDHHLVSLAGEERRIAISTPVRVHAFARWTARAADQGEAGRLLDSLHRALSLWASASYDSLGSERGATAMLAVLAEEANLLAAVALRLAHGLSPEEAEWIERMFVCLAKAAEFGGRARSALGNLSDFAQRLLAQAPGQRVTATAALYLGRLKTRTADLAGARAGYEVALAIYRQIDGRLGEANALTSLGDLKRRIDDLAGARADYEAALAIYRQIDDRLGEANALTSLGDLKRRTDDLAGPLADYTAALAIYRQIDARLGEANALTSLGELKMRTDDLAGARADYAAALAIYRQIDARLGEANVLAWLGDLKRRTDDLAGARADYEAALAIYRQIDARLGEANSQRSLGDLKARTDDLAGARADYEAALAIYRQIGARLGEANALRSLGDLKTRTDDLVGARADYEAALPIYRQIDDRLGEANALTSLGDLKALTADLVGARADYEVALPIYRQTDDRLGEANALTSLGNLKARTADLVGAHADYEAALPICRQIDDRLGEANALTSIGKLYVAHGNLAAGFRTVAHALLIRQQINDQAGIGESL